VGACIAHAYGHLTRSSSTMPRTMKFGGSAPPSRDRFRQKGHLPESAMTRSAHPPHAEWPHAKALAFWTRSQHAQHLRFSGKACTRRAHTSSSPFARRAASIADATTAVWPLEAAAPGSDVPAGGGPPAPAAVITVPTLSRPRCISKARRSSAARRASSARLLPALWWKEFISLRQSRSRSAEEFSRPTLLSSGVHQCSRMRVRHFFHMIGTQNFGGDVFMGYFFPARAGRRLYRTGGDSHTRTRREGTAVSRPPTWSGAARGWAAVA
jgi:hypothetical protein